MKRSIHDARVAWMSDRTVAWLYSGGVFTCRCGQRFFDYWPMIAHQETHRIVEPDVDGPQEVKRG